MNQQLFEKKIDAAAFNDLSPDDPWKEPGEEAGGAVAEVAQVGPEASRRGVDVGVLHLCNCVRTKHDSHHRTHLYGIILNHVRRDRKLVKVLCVTRTLKQILGTGMKRVAAKRS